VISAISGEPPERLDQFRSQFYTAGIDLKPAIKNLALTTVNIKKTAGGPGIEDITALILYFFKAAFPALLAEVVPIRIFC
jgi:hypothetical protein